MGELTDAGCVAFSQARAPIADTQVLWRALQYAATFGYHGVAARRGCGARAGAASRTTARWRRGWACPAFRRSRRPSRSRTLLELARATGARVHVCRLSTAGAVELVRRAKAEKLPVTCDVAIHHLHLSRHGHRLLRLAMPAGAAAAEPARPRRARARSSPTAWSTAWCSDHTPVDEDGKHLPFAEAEPGATGLELLLPLTLKWGEAHKLPLAATLARISTEPAKVLGLDTCSIAPGAPADLAIFDPRAAFRVAPQTLRSQGKNTPFLGYELFGRVRYTLVAGNVVYEA